MDCKTDKLDEAGEEQMLSAALKSPTMLHPVPPRLARRVKALSPGMAPRCRLLFARRRWSAAAAALCALAAVGAAINAAIHGGAQNTAGARSERAASAAAGWSRSRATAAAGIPETPDIPDINTGNIGNAGNTATPLSNSPTLPLSNSTQGEPTMNTTALRSLAASAAFAASTVAPLAASAKTIALWPMDLDPDSGAFYGTNAIHAANGLSLVSGSSAAGLDWALPSNPDASGMAFSPLNGGTAVASSGGRYTMEATGTFGDRVSNTNEFTMEGWVKISATQTASWMIILQAGSGSGAKNGGWILSWRGTDGARKFHLTVPADNNNANGYDNPIGPTLSSAFEAALVDSWHHLALTHKVEGGQDVWKLYIDGENEIEGTAATVRKAQSGAFSYGTYRNLYFGGRPNADNRLNGAFDYWRVSDKALEPSEFLCADMATPGSGESMVAYLAPEGTTHSQWISTGVSLKGDARKTCTVEIWAYPLSGSSIDQQFIEQFGGGNGRMNLNRRNSDGKLRMWMGGYTGAEMFSNSVIPLDTWTHIAWVADGDTWRLYINGELDAESTGHSDHLLDASSADGFVIGNTRSNDPNGQSNAYFAEARVWKCARTTAEILATMNTRIADAWKIADLIGYWPLADGAADYALNGNKARNYAVLDPTKYTPSGAANFNYSYAIGNRVGWVASALPVTGTLQGEHSAICNAGVRTNAVDTLVTSTPEAFTIMGWYLVNGSAANLENDLFDKMMVANGRMRLYEKNGALTCWMGGGFGTATNEGFTVANCMPIGAWTHVALTKSGGTVKIYVNGEQVGENNAFTMDLCNANLCVGGFDVISSSGGFNGAFRNVGFWSKAMSVETIKAHMYALPKLDDEKLLGYWPLDDGEGDTVSNLKTGGAAGQPVGNGFFVWNKGVNILPAITETVKPTAFVISIR